MFVKFAIEPEALDDADDASFERVKRNCWLPNGILVDSGSLVNSSNPDYRSEIETAIKNFHSSGSPLFVRIDDPIDWQSTQACSDLERYQDIFALALIEEARALEFGVPESDGEYSKICGGIEAIRFSHADLAIRLENAKDLSQRMIRKGMSVEDLWQERFRLLAMYSKRTMDRVPQVTIVDRYAVPNIINASRNDGLFNLLRFVHAEPPGCMVTIFSGYTNTEQYKFNAYRRLDEEIANLGLSKAKGIRQIQVFLCPSRLFGNESHDRHIRFNEFTCEIGTGVEVFSGSEVPRNSTFALKPPTQVQTYIEIANNLKDGKLDDWRWPPRG